MEKFPTFSLERLLKTVFLPKPQDKIAILIDLKDPKDIVNFAYLKKPNNVPQKKAYEVFYQEIKNGLQKKLNIGACDMYAYEMTGGSNLELPEVVTAPDGTLHNLVKDIYPTYQIILCIGTYSATAPLTAAAKVYGFKGATMHGVNDIILKSGLAVDYNEVSIRAEKLRQALTRADSFDVDFELEGNQYSIHIDLGNQEAQKSHGLCREKGEMANLPAGEVYFVPKGGEGKFPLKFEEDGSLAVLTVSHGAITDVKFIKGHVETVKRYQAKLESDPAAAILGELGLGTQELPFADADIQDEKIFGTFHIATGRNDHLQGTVTKDLFKNLKNATHEDILFSPQKTPEIHIKQVKINKDGNTHTLIENDQPTAYYKSLGE